MAIRGGEKKEEENALESIYFMNFVRVIGITYAQLFSVRLDGF
jgi:hypothetical protein